ncbi:DUF7519 family protein [Haloarcula salina]|uniref:Uncharacterized protein n=1 Tax=Haloarcula salina TaxID=1429914 RepID=A0AA41G096_9EURY|nr:hypothetical protein [Haloarcula salina]MBV0900963.1 hypothetical protein [Haloarcula salina]
MSRDDASTLDRRPAESSSALAGAVATVTALGLGLAVGEPVPALVSLLGGLTVAAGVWSLRESSHARVAVGSASVVLGTAAFTGSAWLTGDAWLLATYLGFALGATFVVVDATSGLVPDDADADPLPRMLRAASAATAVGVGVAALLTVAAYVDLLSVALGAVESGIHPLVGFATLQAGVVAGLLLLDRAVPILDSWLPSPAATTDRALDGLAAVGTDWWEIDRSIRVAVAIQLVVAFAPVAQRLFDRFLASVPVVGRVLRVALSGPLHVPLAACLLLLLGVVAADVVRRWTVRSLGDDPAITLALAAGGIVVPALALLGGTALAAVGVTVPVGDSLAGTGNYAAATAALLGVLVALTACRAVVHVLSAVAREGTLPRRTAGFATGSALLFVTTLVAAELGLAPLLVLAGAAAALLVWDTGAHASSVGAQLGRDAETTDSEFVHVTGTAAVLGVGVVAVLLVRYALFPFVVPTAAAGLSPATVIALGLVLLSVLLVTVALLSHRERPRQRERAGGEG